MGIFSLVVSIICRLIHVFTGLLSSGYTLFLYDVFTCAIYIPVQWFSYNGL